MSIREHLTPSQRATDLRMTIDPGFVHHRKIHTILGAKGSQIINDEISKLPDLPDWQKEVQIDHIYTEIFLEFCRIMDVRPLQYTIAKRKGSLFCSTELLEPCEDIYRVERAVSTWAAPENCDIRAEFHYTTKRIKSDTLKSRLHGGDIPISIVAELVRFKNNLAVYDPIIMGGQWLVDNEELADFDIMWFSYDFFENFIEDFDEFSKVKDYPMPSSSDEMKNISEKAFKMCIAEILGDTVQKDWSGETSDYYTAHLHLRGKRKTAAFLFKGPARFEPMNLNHLGKNNDQIVRLSHEPAQVLIVQHCHDILQAVRQTLRAFAVQPSNPRRYCLIDGRDSLRLLKAYGLFDKALEMSKH